MATKEEPIHLALRGWVHVHTYQESHGAFDQLTYQLEKRQGLETHDPARVLLVTNYRDGSATGVRTETGRDHLLARFIKGNPERFPRIPGAHLISPCCTASVAYYRDRTNGRYLQVNSAAGHGEWGSDLGIEERDDEKAAEGLPDELRASIKATRRDGYTVDQEWGTAKAAKD
jgi:hypothetical protein